MTKKIIFAVPVILAFLAWATAPVPAFAPVFDRKWNCKSLEDLDRLAQARIDRGYRPNARQLADYEARKAWYDQHCGQKSR